MFMLDNTDVLEAWASVDAKIDCFIDGYVGAVYTNLYTGTLSNGANTHVYVAGTDVAVVNSRFTNTHNAPVTLSFKMDPANGGNPKWLTPVDVSLEAGYTLLFDGQRATIIDTSGRVVQSVAVSDAAYGAGWNGITDTAASKNAIYDQMELKATIESPTFTTKITTPIIDLTGGQIAFPASAVPSGDPNTIDDYEKGIWTPSLGGDATYNTQDGFYTKIGNVVHLWLFFDINIIGTGSTATVSGLPFASAAGVNSYASPYFSGSAVNVYSLVGAVGSGLATMQFHGQIDLDGGMNINLAIFQNSTVIIGNLTYGT